MQEDVCDSSASEMEWCWLTISDTNDMRGVQRKMFVCVRVLSIQNKAEQCLVDCSVKSLRGTLCGDDVAALDTSRHPLTAQHTVLWLL